MNAIFLDLDGVIGSFHDYSDEFIESKIKLLADICHTYNCVVVISAAAKTGMDYYTCEAESEWMKEVLSLLKKYNITCIGRTPVVEKKIRDNAYIGMWKEDEIRLYLCWHPEIKHIVVLDDDDLGEEKSDLKSLKEYLVKTDYYNEDTSKCGLLPEHKEEIGRILQKKLVIKKFSTVNRRIEYTLPVKL